MNKKIPFCAVLASLYFISPIINASVEDPYVLRFRWLIVDPQNNSNDISLIGGTASVNASIVPEVDISYFFTENIAAELITAVTRHQVRANGTTLGNLNLGEVTLLPPTLTLQWHFLPECIMIHM